MNSKLFCWIKNLKGCQIFMLISLLHMKLVFVSGTLTYCPQHYYSKHSKWLKRSQNLMRQFNKCSLICENVFKISKRHGKFYNIRSDFVVSTIPGDHLCMMHVKYLTLIFTPPLVISCLPYHLCFPLINTLRLRQNGHNFVDDILKCTFLNENL